MTVSIQLEVNGKPVQAEVEPRRLLVHFLREDLSLTGTNIGCETSLCGACTVLVDGNAVKSCTMLALQEGFWEKHGLQCGYCTPGMILSANYLLAQNPSPSDEEIREGLKGNICRCTGYHNIVEAVKYAAERMS